MNSQNILKFYGSRLDLKLDSSEFYDYEISKTQGDYNLEVLDLNTPIVYSSLIIDDTMSYMDCVRNTIELTEMNNTINDENYIYSGLTLAVNYQSFTSQIGPNYHDTILNNDILTYTGITGEVHYFYISGYNVANYLNDLFGDISEVDAITGFTTDIIKCWDKLSDSTICCPTDIKINAKPYAYQFNHGGSFGDHENIENYNDNDEDQGDECDFLIRRRTEAGWSLDFVFNRNGLDWSSGNVFYYIGVRGDDDLSNYADNNLSFRFTNDGRIKWTAVHYSGYCQSCDNNIMTNPDEFILSGATPEYSCDGGYHETYYVSHGQTPILCVTDPNKDFNITITFDRYAHYDGCAIANDGGWNDLINNSIISNSEATVLSGETATYEFIEELNKKWADERKRRLGTLKIYLNGRPIYKVEDFEEVIPSKRGYQPYIQSWGGGTGLMDNYHNGVCCFNIKTIKYYEEPLDFVHVNHNFITRMNEFDFEICGVSCNPDIYPSTAGHIIEEDGSGIIISTEDQSHLIYRI